MVRNDEQLIDLACIDGITVPEIAERIGVHKATVERFLRRNRDLVEAARAETAVSDSKHAEVLALWGESVPREEIARRTAMSTDVVRRLLLAAEYDEQPDDQGAALELMALQMAHPGRMYMDDLRAVHETRVWLSAPDTGLRRAA